MEMSLMDRVRDILSFSKILSVELFGILFARNSLTKGDYRGREIA